MGLEMIRVKSCRAASALVLMSLLALVGGCVRPASLTVPLTLDALDKTPGAKLTLQRYVTLRTDRSRDCLAA